MNNVLEAPKDQGVTVLFGERFTQSEHFDAIFREGMELVERTASYLDGEGRREARKLKAPISVAYATESMRLTTRLLELASWLLVHRGLRDGEISDDEAARRREQTPLRTFGRPQSIKQFVDLPRGLRDLIRQSVALMDRIVHIDAGLNALDSVDDVSAKALNPVSGQIAALNAAFAGAQR